MRSLSTFFYVSFLCFFSVSVQAQISTWIHPDSILLAGQEKPVPVLLVGAFHFAYYNLDAYKIDSAKQVDVLSPERQKEMQALVDYIAQFKPTKIAVEGGRHSGYIIRRFERWQKGAPLGRHEIDQIAFPIMLQQGLDTLYGVDALSWVREKRQWSSDSTAIKSWVDPMLEQIDALEQHPIELNYQYFFAAKTDWQQGVSMLDYFRYINDPEVLRRMHGSYLLSGFMEREELGPEWLAMDWYNRNLRIFRNIQSIVEGPEDRILVIFGAGHMSILQELFIASPVFEWIPFNGLGK